MSLQVPTFTDIFSKSKVPIKIFKYLTTMDHDLS